MGMIKHTEVLQGSDEWFALRCGLMTASEMKLIITPKNLQYASNDKERSHLYELVAQRITQYVEPSYIGDDMIRGQEDEITARELYAANYCAPGQMELAGFITKGQPTAIAGAILCAARLSGKLKGETKLHGPMGTRFHMP